MSDTLFADVSSYQARVNDSYPYKFISFRSNDGTYRDSNLAANLAWAKSAVQRKKLTGFIVYFVWETNWQQTIATLKSMVGTPDPHMAIMIDVESWSGSITGDHSSALNATRETLIAWLGGNRNRVIGYANMGDLASLWPNHGDTKFIIASYGANPYHPSKIAHQFADNFIVPPFGACDINSADGLTDLQFAAELGLPIPNAPTPAPIPHPNPSPGPGPTPTPPLVSIEEEEDMLVLNADNKGQSGFWLFGGRAMPSLVQTSRLSWINGGGKYWSIPGSEFTAMLNFYGGGAAKVAATTEEVPLPHLEAPLGEYVPGVNEDTTQS